MTGKSIRVGFVILAALWACIPQARAQGAFNLHENTIERLSQAREVSPLSVDTVFGDQVGLFNGSASFTHVDISVPGNDALPVELRRILQIEDRSRANGHFLGGFGEWALDLPRLSSEVSTSAGGWRPNGGTVNQRCSVPGPLPHSSTVAPEDYWSGYQLTIPGAGGQQLLMNPSSSIPAAGGGPYPWITKDMWRIGCKSASKNGYAGEAFTALSPQGVTYHLDWAVAKAHAKVNGDLNSAPIDRQVVHFLVSRVEDRFGNWVDYSYSGDKLTGITASDGRQITLTWSGNNVASATSSIGNWSYTYTSGRLTQVTRPDGSKWSFVSPGAPGIGPIPWSPAIEDPIGCPDVLEAPSGTYTLSITAPSGATGVFQFDVRQHLRSNIPEMACTLVSMQYWFMRVPRFHWSLTLVSKTVTGPGLPTMTWNYSYGAPDPLFNPDSKQNVVTGPDSTWTRYTYGTGFNLNEGQLLAVEEGSSASNILQTRTDTYITTAEAASQHFPSAVGLNPRGWSSDALATMWLRPLRQSTTTRQGTTFTRQIPNACSGKYCFDVFARPTRSLRSSTLSGSPSRTEETSYHDNTTKWVLGQVSQVKCTAPTTALPAGCGSSGTVISATTFDGTWALPLVHQQFGRTVQTLTWDTTSAINTGQRGTVATVKDGNNATTTVSSWKRGIPQSIQHPATPESPSGATQSATVNNAGWITEVTDENGYKTCYAHDAMGRISQVTWPSESAAGVCNATTWAVTTQAFVQATGTEHGLPAGHWKQTIATGNGRKVTWFDGLWRPLIVREYDTANESGTQRFSRFAWNHRGQATFAAYPATVHNATTGTHSTYDALGRPVTVSQDSELGTLTTAYAYLGGFQTRITDPKSNQTTTSYLAWDQPATDFPVLIAHPASAWTHIARDVFGKPTRIRRSDNASPTGGTGVNRDYAYHADQLLCRSVEPETGATLLGYDGAGNVKWSAAGLSAGQACEANGTSGPVAARRVDRTWDARNRLTALAFPDGKGNQAWTYTPDGLPATISTNNASGSATVGNSYSYNRRRLPTQETLVADATNTWTLGTGYNANGHLTSHVYPAGLTVAYTVNALGQPTQVAAQDVATVNVASAVSYFPNGAVKQFTYGNGMVHTATQNTRSLPLRMTDCAVAGSCANADRRLDLEYGYDGNGNVGAITDHVTGAKQTRAMTYDARDRLTGTTSNMFGTASYGYDALDNLTTVNVTGGSQIRNHHYCYSDNRLATVRTGSCGGSIEQSLTYDVQGNLASKGGQTFNFDYGNRLREISGVAYYLYDGHGLRVRSSGSGSAPYVYGMYDRGGVLRWQRDEVTNQRIRHIYLGNRLLAEHRKPIGANTETIEYLHTDALGSPIARTNSSKTTIQSSEHEPYGLMVNRANDNRPGFTGHVMDAGTGLTYIQQRYMDPVIGIFLSVDPVMAYSSPVGMFNRYRYANNNPYGFIDQDGRAPNKAGVTSSNHVYNELRTGDLVSLRDSHQGNVDRYFYTSTYGWVDIRHFAEAANLVNSGWPSEAVRVGGVLNEALQWTREWGDAYRSGFSPEDLPSNAAGIDFGKSIKQGESLADAFMRWAKLNGAAVDPWSQETGFSKLPDTDPSVKGGADRGSSNSNSNPKGPDISGSNTVRISGRIDSINLRKMDRENGKK